MDAFWAEIIATLFFSEHGRCGHRAAHRWKDEPVPIIETVSYGAKAGSPRCVHAGWANFHYHQCDKAGSYRDGAGRWWCGVHSPVAWARRRAAQVAKEEARRARWDYERAVTRKAATRKAAGEKALDALRQIEAGHNDPRALAAEVLALLD